MLSRLFWDATGASAIEYSLLAALIAIGLATSGPHLGGGLAASMELTDEALSDGPGSEDNNDGKGKGKGKDKKGKKKP